LRDNNSGGCGETFNSGGGKEVDDGVDDEDGDDADALAPPDRGILVTVFLVDRNRDGGGGIGKRGGGNGATSSTKIK
jgi:hypothetical protein